MSKGLENHMESISAKKLVEYTQDSFTMYARARGVELGFTPFNEYAVRHEGEIQRFDNPQNAVDEYITILNEKI